MIMVIDLKVYVDGVLLLNFFFDFLLLLLVSYFLKRRCKIYRIILGAVVGSISILFLFLKLSSLSLFLLKVVISIFMILITFGYKDGKYFLKNFLYLYIISIFLGGIIYFLDVTFSYKNKGIIFFNKGLSVNFFLLLIISPVLLYLYLKQLKNYKLTYSLIHKVELSIDNKKYIYNGYLDTGNKLVDQYKKRPIILVYDLSLQFEYEDSILVPYNTLENKGIIKCKKVDNILIDDKEVIKNVLVGVSTKKFSIEGIDCILPNIIKEDLI